MRSVIILWVATLSLLLSACAGAANSGTLVIVGKEMKFEQAAVTVRVGEPVTLVFENQGALMHALVLDEFGVALEHIQPGASGTATFTPEQPGTYTFYCSEPGHREADMIGTLIVTQ